VRPPVGWGGEEGEVTPLGIDEKYGQGAVDYGPDRSLTDEYYRQQWQQDIILGSDASESDVARAQEDAVKNIVPKLSNRSPDLVRLQVSDIVAALDGLTPAEKLLVIRSLERQIVTGRYNAYKDSYALTPLDAAWQAATGIGAAPEIASLSTEDRKFAVVQALGAELDILVMGSEQSKTGLMAFYQRQGALADLGPFLLNVEDENLLRAFQAWDEVNGFALGSPLSLVWALTDIGMRLPESGAGNVAFVEGAVDMVVSVSRYDKPADQYRAAGHAFGRTVASGVVGAGIYGAGTALIASIPACGPIAPACVVIVLVVSGAAAYGANKLVQQDEIVLPGGQRRRFLGWNY
jgi:hypothetical protein